MGAPKVGRFFKPPGQSGRFEKPPYSRTTEASKRKRQTVVGEAYIRRQRLVNGVMIHVVTHVREVRLVRPELGDHVEGLAQRQMAGVRLVPPGIQDEDAQAFEPRAPPPRGPPDVGAGGPMRDAGGVDA